MESVISDSIKLKVYKKAEKIWNSDNVTAKDKAEAWRLQRTILLESVPSPAEQEALLRQHHKKLKERNSRSIGQHAGSLSEAEIAGQLTEIIHLNEAKSQTLSVNNTIRGEGSVAFVASSAMIARDADSTQQETVKTRTEFRSARELLTIQNLKKNQPGLSDRQVTSSTPVGSERRGLFNFNATKRANAIRPSARLGFAHPGKPDPSPTASPAAKKTLAETTAEPADARLTNIDPKMVELITNEIVHKYKPIDWKDIAGLSYAKSLIKEAIVFPLLRPDIFTGLRRPPRGMLLFGPPGTGKTMMGKCIASQSDATFFSISASSLTSKWVGDGEKMVRALFAVAAVHQPSVIFIDEIDSLLTKRSENDHESSRRIKTEFLVQFDGATTSEEDRVIVIGATNRPQELDEAARRRFVRRLYVPLPDEEARIQILRKCLQCVGHNLSEDDLTEVAKTANGYSGADMDALCREASMEPIRSIPLEEMRVFRAENVRPICLQDFRLALQSVRPTVSQQDLDEYIEWNCLYGALKHT